MSTPTFEDWLAIVGALNRLGALYDARDWDHLDEVLLPDGLIYGQRGLEALLENNLLAHLGGCGPSQHFLGNYDIAVDGDTATSDTRVRAFHRGADELADRTFETFGVYHDRWVRTAQGWRMAERELQVDMNIGDISVLKRN